MLRLNPTTRRAIARAITPAIVVGDVFVAVAALEFAYLARFEGVVPALFSPYVLPTMAIAAVVVPIVFAVGGLYGYVWRQVGVDMIVRLAAATVLIATASVFVDVSLSSTRGSRIVPIGVLLIASVLLFVGSGSLRAVPRITHYLRTRRGVIGGRPVLIAGAGDAGSLLLRDIESRPDLGISVVGFVDDALAKRGKALRSARVLGAVEDIETLASRFNVAEVLVAMPGVSADARARVLDVCARAGVKARVLPGLADQASRSSGIGDLRDVQVEDLIGREVAPIAVESIARTIQGQRVVVTGAAGSIGSELCRQLVALSPSALMLLDIDESRLYEVYLELVEEAPGLPQMRICDIRDDRKLLEILREFGPSVVLHAAAYKHVPLMEIEPDEAVKTNVIGTKNVLNACVAAHVDRFVLISTDKAVAPKSVMGMTKAIAERLAMDACRRGLHTTAVRFGNVLGSRGSVLPLFEEQLRRGSCLKVTHPDITRYFMTISEAARLVLQAQALSDGGDIFVLEMGEPVKIVDLAKKLIALSGREIRIEFTGLRPAEKLHEVLVNPGEVLLPAGADKIGRLSAITVPPHDLAALVHALATASRVNDRALLRPLFYRLLPEAAPLADSALDFLDEEESAAAISVLDPDMETVF